jgi:type I restriction enzyme S subunit
MEKQKNIPQLRFPDFKGEWEKKKLGELSAINPTTDKLPEKFIYIDLESVINGDLTKEVFVFKNAAPSRAQRVLERDDILFQMVRPYQKNNLYFDKSGDYVASTGYAQIKTKQNSRFIYQYLHLQKFVDEVIERCTGTSYPAINSKDLAKISIRYPSLPEQQKIASFFTAIDLKISQLKRKKILLEQYKKGVMQKIFSQEIRFKDDNGQEFPKWEKKRLGDVFTEINESVGERDIPTYSITAGIGFVSQKEKFGRNISGQQNKNYTVIDEGQFSYNKGNSKTYKYGCVYLNDTGEKIAVPNVFISFERVDPKMSTKYYSKLFESHYLDKELRKIISSSARMDGLLNVNKNSFFKLKVPCLNHYEQHKIGDFLCSLDNKIQNTQKQIEQAEQWKKGLMQQMFV